MSRIRVTGDPWNKIPKQIRLKARGRRMSEEQRAKIGAANRGKSHPCPRKFSDAQAEQIRQDPRSRSEIARELGVSAMLISMVKRGLPPYQEKVE